MTYWEAVSALEAECENLDIDDSGTVQPCDACYWCSVRQAIINELEGD